MIKIRSLQKKDIPAVVKIVRKNFSLEDARKAPKELKEMFNAVAFPPVYYVAEEDGIIIGSAGYNQSWIDYAIYQIFWVNVAPERQGQGIGKKLVSKIIGEIRKNKNSSIVLLSASAKNNLPNYYIKNFKFTTAETFKGDSSRHHLMSLKIKK